MNVRNFLASVLVTAVVVGSVCAVDTKRSASQFEKIVKEYNREIVGAAIAFGVAIPATAAAAWFVKGYCTETDVKAIMENKVAKKAVSLKKLAGMTDKLRNQLENNIKSFKKSKDEAEIRVDYLKANNPENKNAKAIEKKQKELEDVNAKIVTVTAELAVKEEDIEKLVEAYRKKELDDLDDALIAFEKDLFNPAAEINKKEETETVIEEVE